MSFLAALCVVERSDAPPSENPPCFSGNLSTFMSNCVLVVTTLNSRLAGCSSHKARASAPCGPSPARGFFAGQV